ncbi:thioredoxin [Candidatus Woesearchaeota archaeon]|nr:thioredoxin [Candidatus Woesearchaeota archaeon]MCF7901702.1 thioredoxin [Candidatus Woesearchaeota archaeon]MCF8013001.1 thioredoxin [Candidatus Woesearchaeota archaeon]
MKKLTKENFKEEVLQSETPVIIDFYADWCGPCKMMGPVFEELSKEYEGKLKFLKLDTETEQEIAGQFQIRGIPSISIIKGSEEIDRIVGFNPKEALKQKIDTILAKI